MMMTGIILSLIFPLGLKMLTDIHGVTKDENMFVCMLIICYGSQSQDHF